jgi:hypothetical protein
LIIGTTNHWLLSWHYIGRTGKQSQRQKAAYMLTQLTDKCFPGSNSSGPSR